MATIIMNPTDLTDADLEFLEQENLCQKPIAPGKRTVSGAFLSSPSASLSSSSSSSSSASASVRIRNFNTGSQRSFDIPIRAESAEALEFIGFVPQTANYIFRNYQTRPDPDINPDDLMSYVYSHICALNTRDVVNLPPRQALSRIGLTTKQQDALLDPRFTLIFWTESLFFWVKDTLETNYAALVRLQQRIKNHTRGGRKKKRASIQEAFAGPAGQADPPQVTLTVNMTPKDYNLPANHIALGTEGPVLADHLVLYKGKCPKEMPEEPFIRDNGSLDMRALASAAGGDFNYQKRVWYFTAEKTVAEEYRAWAARRSQMAETWLIRIQIPNSFLTPLTRAELWYGSDWKEYVWYCKNQEMPPAKFDHLHREGKADVIRGHICTGVTKAVKKIKEEDVQTAITRDFLLKIPNTIRPATQYAFMQDTSVKRLAEVIRGKIQIDITDALEVHHGP